MSIVAHTLTLEEKLQAQKELAPAIYGNVDYSLKPERFADAPDDESYLGRNQLHLRPALIADKDRVAFIRAYTFIGDAEADAYAGLMKDFGFRPLVNMLMQACDHGIDSVPDCPDELRAFIAAMEYVPEWLDMDLVEQGARIERNGTAHLLPFLIRGGLFATFRNKYAALPMAVTNNLASNTAERRIKETATFFATSTLPNALTRFGPGFHAAAMVRLMHSMVRTNIMRSPNTWDTSVYGVPIPQVDQMPAGMFGMLLLSYQVLAEGRTEFSPAERARVEFARYRCVLLGLPEDLLSDTPQGIVDLMVARGGTLRAGFEEETCGELLKAVMAANLRKDNSIGSRIFEKFERSFSKVFFVQKFESGDRKGAAKKGVKVSGFDYFLAGLTGMYVQSRMKRHARALKDPAQREEADRRAVRRIRAMLASFGHAEFTTDASNYRKSARGKAAAQT